MTNQPLTHTRIGYDTITDRATITASAAISGYPAAAAASALTYSFWSAALPATWQAQLEEAEPVNYFGIAAHTLNSNHAMAVVQAWIDAAWKTLPVLTTTGDLWPFDDDLYGKRGGANISTVGNLRRGVAVDGESIYPYISGTARGGKECKFGHHCLAVEPSIENILLGNNRTCGDVYGDTTSFTGDVAYSTARAVSGAGCILLTAGGGSADLQTVYISADPNTYYTAQCKISCLEVVGEVKIAIWGDVSGEITSATYDDIPAGDWSVLTVSAYTGGSDSTVAVWITIDDGAAYVDEMQLEEGQIAHTWIDGTQAAGNLEYQPEILQQIAEDCTLSIWARMPSSTSYRSLITCNTGGGYGNFFGLTRQNATQVGFYTGNAAGSVDQLLATFGWDDDWHMITAVLRPGVSGEDNKELYIDGRLVASTETTKTPTWNLIDTFEVGHANGGSTRMTSDGETLMDDLFILNRAATAAEIKEWFERTEAMDPATLGLPSHDDDRPIMVLVEEHTSHRFRVRVAGQSTPVIGVIRMGKALEMERPIYGGHTPLNLSRTTVIRPNISERGQFLGRSIIRSGASGSWSWKNLTAAWVRRYLDPFLEAIRTTPFFILWRPSSFPGEAGYCWTTADHAPTNMGSKDRMSITIDAEGLGNE